MTDANAIAAGMGNATPQLTFGRAAIVRMRNKRAKFYWPILVDGAEAGVLIGTSTVSTSTLA
jgi:hypothetical protein